MKRLYPVLCFILLTTFSTTTNAATYMAVASGNYSSNSTWQGGVAPGFILLHSDTLVIPAGITITQDVTLPNVNYTKMYIEGNITAANPNIYFGGNLILYGNGTITLDSMNCFFSGSGGFTGTVNLRAFRTRALGLQTVYTINISELLHIGLGGSFHPYNAKVNLGSGALIHIESSWGKIFDTVGIDLSKPFDVLYTGYARTGAELKGSGLRDITLDACSLILENTFIVKNRLEVSSGSVLHMENRNYDIVFEKGADINIDPNSSIEFRSISSSGSPTNNMIIRSNGVNGALNFASVNGNTLNDLVLDMETPTATVKLASDLKIEGELTLNNGKLDIQGNRLLILEGGKIIGSSRSSYVIAENSEGELVQYINDSSRVLYPIGTNNYYAPARVKGNPGNWYTLLGFNVMEGVLSGGRTGYSISDTKPVVGTTWFTKTFASKPNVDVTLMWRPEEEKNGFSRWKCMVATNNEEEKYWVPDTAKQVTSAGTMYMQTKRGITDLYKVALTVFDNSGAVSVEDVAENEVLRIYPNPAGDVLHVAYQDEAISTATIYSITGQQMLTTQLKQGDNIINIQALSKGVYFLKLNGEMHRFIKQ